MIEFNNNYLYLFIKNIMIQLQQKTCYFKNIHIIEMLVQYKRKFTCTKQLVEGLSQGCSRLVKC